MKYSVIQISNGNFSIVFEDDDKEKAIVNYHGVCQNLWNAADVEHACVAIVNELMNVLKIELIKYSDQAIQ